MGNDRPFALFVLVDLEHKTIDEILGATLPGYAPVFWLATERYEDAPKSCEGCTSPPTPEDFQSPWIGRQLDELVQWVKAKPEGVDLNKHHFAILDRRAKDEPPTIVICRVGDVDLKGDMLFLVRNGVVDAVDILVGAPSNYWDILTREGTNMAELEYNDGKDGAGE